MLVEIHTIQVGAKVASNTIQVYENLETLFVSLLANIATLQLQTQIDASVIISYLLDFTKPYNSQYIAII